MSFKLPKYKGLIRAICIASMIGIGSCKSPTQFTVDEKSIMEFHAKTDSAINRLDSHVNLFIDYSTCMVEAVKSSKFFSQIRPRITGLNPTLYGIKGDKIEMISSDNVSVNVELNKITEYPYADLIHAFSQICDTNNQAILITDGEYWTPGIGEMTDIPYFKDPLVKWLSKGYEVYVYVEDYNEPYHGRLYSKKRCYFVFSDDNLKNNIFQELKRAFPVSPVSSTLKLYKLSGRDFLLGGKLVVYDQIESTLITEKGFTALDIGSDWGNLDMYVLNATNADDGTSVAGGNYLIRGLKITPYPDSVYTFPELDIKVYNVSENYLDSTKEVNLESCEAKDLFILDKELYKGTGEIGIKMSKNYSNSLSEETENLLRIDIVAKETKKRLNMEDFIWQSLSGKATNISIYQSILQTIEDQAIDPARSGKPLYTIYLKTKAYKI